MTLITSFGVLALAGIVNGHGYLTIPKSRVALGFEVILSLALFISTSFTDIDK